LPNRAGCALLWRWRAQATAVGRLVELLAVRAPRAETVLQATRFPGGIIWAQVALAGLAGLLRRRRPVHWRRLRSATILLEGAILHRDFRGSFTA
jgi:uncharacterized protein (TIGR03382 family)